MVESTQQILNADRKILLVIVSPGRPGDNYLRSVFEDGNRITSFGRKYNFEITELLEHEATALTIDRFLATMDVECYKHAENNQNRGKFLYMIYYSGHGSL